MNSQLFKTHIKKSDEGFILLGSAMAIFLILGVFSIFLLKIIVSENSMSNFNLFDIKTRNLSISGLEYGIQRFKHNQLISAGTINKSINNGTFEIQFTPSTDQNNSPLPYTHFGMLKRNASIG